MGRITQLTETLLNIVTGLGAVVVGFAVSFFLSPFIVRHLGAEANGFAQLASNFVMYASLLTLAFNSMASRFVTVAYHQGNMDEARRYYSSVFVANLAMILLFIPLAAGVVAFLPRLVVIETADIVDIRLLFSCVFINYFLSLVSSLYSMALFVKNRVYIGNAVGAARTVLNALALLAVFSFLPVHVFYVSALASVWTLLLLPVYIFLQRRLLPELSFRLSSFSTDAVKRLFFSGIWNTVNQCGHLLNTGLDVLLANLFVSPAAMGLVAVSKTIPGAIITLAGTLNQNCAPAIIQTWARGDKATIMRELRGCMKISSVLVSVPIVVFCVFGHSFYSLWQPTLEAKTLTVLSVLGLMPFVPVAGTQTLYNVFTATNRLQVNSIAFLVNGVLNVLVVFLALRWRPDLGIYFIVGVSSVLTIVRSLTVTLPYTAHLLGLRWHVFYRDMGLSLVCAGLTGLVSLGVLQLRLGGWLGLSVMVGFATAASLAVNMAVVLSPEERVQVLRRLKLRK